jgi:hypothetical protein
MPLGHDEKPRYSQYMGLGQASRDTPCCMLRATPARCGCPLSSPITFILDSELGYNSISRSRYGKMLNDHTVNVSYPLG